MDRRYYDPGVRPYPERPVHAAPDPGPVGNSRNQRRERRKLSFAEQHRLAKSMGFPVPDSADRPDVEELLHWIEVWETRYAAL